MSGIGQRFIDVGYSIPKPLIKIGDKTIIEYVIGLFPGEENFTFICNSQHLTKTNMREVLNEVCPKGKIIEIQEHKLGPVYSVNSVMDLVNENEPIIVNYCDFFMIWDYSDFKKTVFDNNCYGAIPCYTGFHPHLLHNNNVYASCKLDNEKQLIEIKEKYSFNEDKTKAHHSAGTYYFKDAKTMKKYFNKVLEKKINFNREYYVSLVYNFLVQDKLPVYIYDKINYFCQWGTPEDLAEFKYWDGIFNQNLK